MKLSPPIHSDPVTYQMAYYLHGEGRTRANWYICYAPDCPSNASHYGAGGGATERDALLNATYWPNQAHCIRVVPASRAPRWAIAESSGDSDFFDRELGAPLFS